MKKYLPLIISLSLGCVATAKKVVILTTNAECAPDRLSEKDFWTMREHVDMSETPVGTPWAEPSGNDVSPQLPDLTNSWENPQSSKCIRIALLQTPYCSGPAIKSPIPQEFHCWHANNNRQFANAIQRFQKDQKGCSLDGLYSEYKNLHTDSYERAAYCVGLLSHDPHLQCLSENRKALRELVRHWPQRVTFFSEHGQIDPKYLGEKYLITSPHRIKDHDQTFEMILVSQFLQSELWTAAYDEPFQWWYQNVQPITDQRDGRNGKYLHQRLDIIHAYRQKDREKLLHYVATSVPEESNNEALLLLVRLGLQGDEYGRLITMNAHTQILSYFTPEGIKSIKVVLEQQDRQPKNYCVNPH